MRVVTVRIGDRVVDMRPTWGAIRRIAQRVRDPWELAHQAATQQGSLLFNAEAAAAVLHVGVTESGTDVTEEEVGQAILTMGMGRASLIVGDYLTALVEGAPERALSGGGDTKKK